MSNHPFLSSHTHITIMARLSTEHYRDQSNSSSSMGKRISSLFKGRRSLPEGSSPSSIDNGNNKLLKPGFEKVGLFPEDRAVRQSTDTHKHAKRPSITMRPSTAPAGEFKKIPHAIDTNLEPAATKTSPTNKTEFERVAPLWVEAEEVLVQGKKDGDEGGLTGIEEEAGTTTSDPSTSSGTRTLATLDTIAHTPTIQKALRVMGIPQSAENEGPSTVNDKLDILVKPADSVSNVPSPNESPAKADVEELRREPSIMTASSWATATGPNSADTAERLGLKDISPTTPSTPQADVASAVHFGVALIFVSLFLASMILAGPKKVLVLIFYAGLLFTLFRIVVQKLGWSEAEVASTVRGGIARGIWFCVPVVNWIAYQTGYLVAPTVEAAVEGFITGYERALLEH
ncbi:hypothetical protein BDV96DRAFT_20416 [Lophiotrema nucula]|uniref:Uncharacterized protein n=1 Tax=Lophiotrema nucula TaxID=690887 RepID=A0A6A5ZFL4_9PLEO|nr:hypothetical protein BDV96DRAFT_20416 [Lophiotrema nucula]